MQVEITPAEFPTEIMFTRKIRALDSRICLAASENNPTQVCTSHGLAFLRSTNSGSGIKATEKLKQPKSETENFWFVLPQIKIRRNHSIQFAHGRTSQKRAPSHLLLRRGHPAGFSSAFVILRRFFPRLGTFTGTLFPGGTAKSSPLSSHHLFSHSDRHLASVQSHTDRGIPAAAASPWERRVWRHVTPRRRGNARICGGVGDATSERRVFSVVGASLLLEEVSGMSVRKLCNGDFCKFGKVINNYSNSSELNVAGRQRKNEFLFALDRK